MNDGTLRNAVDFSSAFSNVNNVKISDLLAFVVMLLFSSICSQLKIACGGDVENCKTMKTSTGEILLQQL